MNLGDNPYSSLSFYKFSAIKNEKSPNVLCILLVETMDSGQSGLDRRARPGLRIFGLIKRGLKNPWLKRIFKKYFLIDDYFLEKNGRPKF